MSIFKKKPTQAQINTANRIAESGFNKLKKGGKLTLDSVGMTAKDQLSALKFLGKTVGAAKRALLSKAKKTPKPTVSAKKKAKLLAKQVKKRTGKKLSEFKF